MKGEKVFPQGFSHSVPESQIIKFHSRDCPIFSNTHKSFTAATFDVL